MWQNTLRSSATSVYSSTSRSACRVALHLVIRSMAREMATLSSQPPRERTFIIRFMAASNNVIVAIHSHLVSDKRESSTKTELFVLQRPDIRLRRSGTMKSQGEIEAAICDGMSRFEQEYMGRGPKDIRAHLIGDLLIVRLQGVLTAAEQHLVTALPAEKGRDLLKQVRTQLIEIARPALEALIEGITGAKLRSLHHDISTVTGEEVVVFSLNESPQFRELKKEASRR